MPNIAAALKSEINRLAKRAVKSEIAGLKTASTSNRRHIAALRREIEVLHRENAALKKAFTNTKEIHQPQVGDVPQRRMTAKAVKTIRTRLGITQQDLAMLVGASPQAVYIWEKNGVPRSSTHLPEISELRSAGKRAIKTRLEELSQQK